MVAPLRMARLGRRLAGCLVALLVGSAMPAVAQVTWNGAASTSFTNAANWEGGIAPTATGTAVFGPSLTSNLPSMTTGTIGGIQFLRPTGGWTLTASTSLTGTGVDFTIDDSLNTSGTTTFNGTMTLANSGAKTFSVGVGGLIRVTDAITNTRGSSAITVNGGVLWTNRLNGRGSIGNSKTGNGTLWITGSSSAIGPTFAIDAGTFIFGNSFALGSGALIDMTPGSTTRRPSISPARTSFPRTSTSGLAAPTFSVALRAWSSRWAAWATETPMPPSRTISSPASR